MVDEIVHRVDGAEGRLRLRQPVGRFAVGELADDGLDGGFDQIRVTRARRAVGKARVGGQLGRQEHGLAKALPLAVVLHRQHQFATIAAGERAVGRDAGVFQTHALRSRLAIARLQIGHGHEFGGRVEQRDAECAARAGALAQQKRHGDTLYRVHAGGDVADGNADAAPRPGRAVDGHQPAFGLHQQVVGFELAHRADLAVAGDVAGDQARVLLAQRVRTEAETLGGAGREVLNEHVGTGQEALHARAIALLAQVEGDRLLAAVDPDEVGGLAVHRVVVVAGEIAIAPLDLDDARAGIGQAAAAVGRGHRVLERDDQYAVQGLQCHVHLTLHGGSIVGIGR